MAKGEKGIDSFIDAPKYCGHPVECAYTACCFILGQMTSARHNAELCLYP